MLSAVTVAKIEKTLRQRLQYIDKWYVFADVSS